MQMIFWIAESEAGDGSGLVQFEAYRGEDYDADGIPKPKALKGGPCETALRAVQHLVELLIVNNSPRRFLGTFVRVGPRGQYTNQI